MSNSKSTTRQTFAGISVIIGVFMVIVAIWLIIVANTDDDCSYQGRNGRYNDLPDRRRYEYGGGGRSREWFCTNTVYKWNVAGGFSIATGILQIVGSGAFYITSSGVNAFNKPKLRTMYWCLAHILYFIGTLISFLVIKTADIFTAHQARPNLGYIYVGSLIINIIACIVFPLLTFCLILRMMSEDRMESHDRDFGIGSSRGSLRGSIRKF